MISTNSKTREKKTEFIKFVFYRVSMTKCDTGAFRGSCEWAHDKFIDRDVKLVINGLSGASGTSEMEKQIIQN